MKEKGNRLIMKRVEECKKGKKKIGEGKGREGIPYDYRANRTKRERERKREKEDTGEGKRGIKGRIMYHYCGTRVPWLWYGRATVMKRACHGSETG